MAKFACGWAAHHAAVFAYCWMSGTTLLLFGRSLTSAFLATGAAFSFVIALGLGVYAWRKQG